MRMSDDVPTYRQESHIQQLNERWADDGFSTDSEAPHTIAGFQLVSVLGRGGMGLVYEAYQPALNRKVALKTLPAGATFDQTTLARFHTEASAAAQLDHPGIVPVFEVSPENSATPWFSMALVEGRTLTAVIREQGQLPAREAAQLILKVCQALAYAHERGVIHRDVKPSNIMIDAHDGEPRLTDFGLAKIASDNSELTSSGEILGTVGYMAPEQAMGHSVQASPCIDVYSAGAVLYHCLVGRRPFQASTTAETLRQVIEDEPVSPRQLSQEIDCDLETICLRCLEKDPAARFTSAESLADELKRFLDGEAIRSRPISLSGRVSRWCRRRPALATACATTASLILLLMIGTPLGMWLNAQRQIATELAATNAARADTQEYFAALSDLREQRYERSSGWTWRTSRKLQQIASLNVEDRDPVELRSLLLGALTSVDARPVRSFAEGVDAAATAFSNDGRTLAMGEVRPRTGHPRPTIRLYTVNESVSEQPGAQDLDVMAGDVFEIPAADPDQPEDVRENDPYEGIRSVAFSHDDRWIAVGTRFGQLLIWNLDSPNQTPRQLLPMTNDMDNGILHVAWTPSDTRVVTYVSAKAMVHCYDVATGQEQFSIPCGLNSFTMASDGRLVVPLPSNKGYGIIDCETGTTQNLPQWTVAAEESVFHASTTMDTLIGWYFGPFGNVPKLSGIDGIGRGHRLNPRQVGVKPRLTRIQFGRGTFVAIAAQHPHKLQLWDAVSGAVAGDMSIEGPVNLMFAASERTGTVAVARGASAQLLQIRSPKQLHASHSPNAVLSAVAVTDGNIQTFRLNHDGSRVAILERHDDRSQRERIICINTQTGEELFRGWAEDTNTARNAPKAKGNRLNFTQHNRLIVSSSVIGTSTLLDEHGWEPAIGIRRPVTSKPVDAVLADGARWTLPGGLVADEMFPQEAVCVTFRCPSYLTKHTELELNVSCDGQEPVVQTVALTPRSAAATNGWQCLLLQRRAVTKHKLIVTAAVKSTDGHAPPDVEFGSAFRIGLQKRSNPWYWSGPLVTQNDGRIVGVDGGDEIKCWHGMNTFPNWEWADTVNDRPSIRDIAAGEISSVFGTRFGHVFLLANDLQIHQLNSGPRTVPAIESGNEVTRVDFDGTRWAVSGHLNGQLRLFDVANVKTSTSTERCRIEAHEGPVNSVTMTSDGTMVASGGEDGVVRFWQRDGDRLVLWTEWKNFANPVIQLQFHPDDSSLFVACRHERGLKILNMNQLMQRYAEYDLVSTTE